MKAEIQPSIKRTNSLCMMRFRAQKLNNLTRFASGALVDVLPSYIEPLQEGAITFVPEVKLLRTSPGPDIGR